MMERAARGHPAALSPTSGVPMEPSAPQVDAIAVIDALSAEIATLTRRAVIAEQRVIDLERQLQSSTIKKESK